MIPSLLTIELHRELKKAGFTDEAVRADIVEVVKPIISRVSSDAYLQGERSEREFPRGEGG
jgi:hypothetical protein